MMKVSINLTLSKILAYVILIIGSAYSFIFQDAATLIATFSAATTIIGIKTYTSSQERKKQMEYDNEP